MTFNSKKILLSLALTSFLFCLYFFLERKQSINKIEANSAWNSLNIEYTRRSNLAPLLVNYLKKDSPYEKSIITNISLITSKIKNLRKECVNYEDLEKEQCLTLESLEKSLDLALNDLKKIIDLNTNLNKDENLKLFRSQLTSLEQRINYNRSRIRNQ